MLAAPVHMESIGLLGGPPAGLANELMVCSSGRNVVLWTPALLSMNGIDTLAHTPTHLCARAHTHTHTQPPMASSRAAH